MANSTDRLNRFVVPAPSRGLIRATAPLNRWLILRGIPGLRDVPLLRAVPGIGGISDIRDFDLPAEHEARLRAVCGPGKATFIAPNHPEFFTDWMIDKEIVSRVAPMTASWATNTVVNGMGGAMQRFWLANNLIAQIPGNAGAGRVYSIDWAVKGHSVLLHPEGAVGWHGDWVAPLMPGAAEMAIEALARGRMTEPAFAAWIAPVVWKLVFLRDVDGELKAECAYVEKRLGLPAADAAGTPAARIFAIYDALLAREETKAGMAPDARRPFASRHADLAAHLALRLATDIGSPAAAPAPEILRSARRWVREQKDGRVKAAVHVRVAADALHRLLRIGPFAWASPTMTQEHAAEHLKRLRADYCSGTLRDTLNRFVPRPAGPRRAVVRVPEPIAVDAFDGDAAAMTAELRRRLQEALDEINRQVGAEGGFRSYSNPFFTAGAREATNWRGGD